MKNIQTNWYKKAKYEDFDKWEELKGDHKNYLIEEMFDQGRIDANDKSETFVGLNTKVERAKPQWTEGKSFNIQWNTLGDGHFESSKIYLEHEVRIGWKITSVGEMYCCEAIFSDSSGKRIGEMPVSVGKMNDEEAKEICEGHASGLGNKKNWDTLNKSVFEALESSEDEDMYNDEPKEMSEDAEDYAELALIFMNDNDLIGLSVDNVLQSFVTAIDRHKNSPLAKKMAIAAVRLRSAYQKASEDPSIGDFSLDIRVDESGSKMLAADLGDIMSKIE